MKVKLAQIFHCREEGCIGKYIPRGPRDFPRAEDVFLIFALGSLSGNTVPRAVFPNTLPREEGVYRKI